MLKLWLLGLTSLVLSGCTVCPPGQRFDSGLEVCAPGRKEPVADRADRGRVWCQGFDQNRVEAQKTDVWCWAASIKAIRDYQGHQQSQEQIAAHVHGTRTNGAVGAEVRAAQQIEVMQALRPEYMQPLRGMLPQAAQLLLTGGKLDVNVVKLAIGTLGAVNGGVWDREIVHSLAQGVPALISIRQKDQDGRDLNMAHVLIVHGATYENDPSPVDIGAVLALATNQPGEQHKPAGIPCRIVSLEVVDPYDGARQVITEENLRQMRGKDWNWTITEHRAKETLESLVRCLAIKLART